MGRRFVNVCGNIMVVDDEEPVLKMVHKALTRAGYACDSTDAVSSALDMINTNDYDIVLSDKNMPSLDRSHDEGGIEIIAYAKKHNPATEVILMTGYASTDSAVKALQLGAVDYIMKPFSIKDLLEKIAFIRSCQTFINAENMIPLYKSFHAGLLEILNTDCHIDYENQQRIMTFFNTKMEYMFRTVKNFERLVLQQRETMGNLASLCGELLTNTPQTDPRYPVFEKIFELASMRI
ncbi:response regulator [bacterium]|nr:response regulator [bacterium]